MSCTKTILPFAGGFEEIKQNLRYYPYFCNLQISRKCNFSCLHCGFSAGRERPNELSTEEFKKVLSQLYDLNCRKVQITGGEPLLRKDVFEIASFGLSLGMEMHLLSNGYLIDEEKVRKIKESGITGVGISIDGLKESHNTMRCKKDSFEKAINALKLLKKHGLYCNVLTTVNKLCLNELDSLYSLLESIGVDSWIIQTTAKVGRMLQSERYALDPDDMQMVCDFVVKSKNKGKLRVVAGDSLGYFGKQENELRDGHCFTGCYAGILQVGILSDGGVIGCLALPHIPLFIEGNVRERPLAEIWFDKKSFAYTRQFSKELLKGKCKNCAYGETCRAGCKSNAFGATGNLHNNPYCVYGQNIGGDN